jgi:AMP-polyphosphate phosphotransferase
MNAANCRVVPIAAPNDEERAHHYLWRFWRHLPRAGRMLIFDRSWYGRVLVERVEGFATPEDWRRAYDEINDFERQITEEDYRNRERWDDYLAAANEMVARTSPTAAPWVLVPANDKRTARIDVLTQVCDRLERLL